MTHIRLDLDGPVATITIDRRSRFNSLDVDTARDLRKAGLQCARDTAVRAVILRGEGGVFCSGADLKYIRDGGGAGGLAYLSPGARPADEGYGAVFYRAGDPGTEFELWDGMYERILRGAFDLAAASDVRSLFNHDANWVLGRTISQPPTLRLSVDTVGLRCDASEQPDN